MKMMMILVLAIGLSALAVVPDAEAASVSCTKGLNATRCSDGTTIRPNLLGWTVERKGRRETSCRRTLLGYRCEER